MSVPVPHPAHESIPGNGAVHARRSGPPRRLRDGGHLGVEFVLPLSGDLDGTWRRAFSEQIVREAQRRNLRDDAAFIEMLTVTGNAITFFLADDTSRLGDYLDAIDTSIDLTNNVWEQHHENSELAHARAERELHERDRTLDEELTRWATAHPART